MTISGYDCWKRKGLSRHRKLESVGAETTSSGSPFQIRGPETFKVWLPTVDSRNVSTTRRLELAERSARRPCRSATTLCLLSRVSSAVTTKTELVPAVHALHTSPTPSCLSTAHSLCPSNSSLLHLSSMSLLAPGPNTVHIHHIYIYYRNRTLSTTKVTKT